MGTNHGESKMIKETTIEKTAILPSLTQPAK